MLGFQGVIASVAGCGDGKVDAGGVAQSEHESRDAGEEGASWEHGGLEGGLLGGVFFVCAGELRPVVEDLVGLEKALVRKTETVTK